MTDCAAQLDAMRRDFAIERVTSRDMLRRAQQLRYQVLRTERDYDVGSGGIEADEYDAHAHHLVLRHRPSETLIGNVRVVTTSRDCPELPMHAYCSSRVFRHVPLTTTGEISRFALSRSRRTGCGRFDLLLRLALMQGVLRVSRELGLTHWCATMEPSLLRLLRCASVHFEPIGPMVDCYGKRQPAICAIDQILVRGREERPAIWEYVTDYGALAPREDERLAA